MQNGMVVSFYNLIPAVGASWAGTELGTADLGCIVLEFSVNTKVCILRSSCAILSASLPTEWSRCLVTFLR